MILHDLTPHTPYDYKNNLPSLKPLYLMTNFDIYGRLDCKPTLTVSVYILLLNYPIPTPNQLA